MHLPPETKGGLFAEEQRAIGEVVADVAVAVADAAAVGAVAAAAAVVALVALVPAVAEVVDSPGCRSGSKLHWKHVSGILWEDQQISLE